jgi:hypothetical protein
MTINDKKLFYPETLPDDIQFLHQDGGGVLMNNEGRFLFSSVSKEKLEQLYAEDFNGNLITNFNDISVIGLLNQKSLPRTEMQEGNTNKLTIINPNDNLIPAPEVDNSPTVTPTPSPTPPTPSSTVNAPNIEPKKPPVFNVEIGDNNGIYEIDLDNMPDDENNSAYVTDDNNDYFEDDFVLIYGILPNGAPLFIPNQKPPTTQKEANDNAAQTAKSNQDDPQFDNQQKKQVVTQTPKQAPQKQKPAVQPKAKDEGKGYRVGNLEKNHNFYVIPGNQNNYRSAQMPVKFNSETNQYEGDFVDAIKKYNIKRVIRMNADKGDNKRSSFPAITTAVEKAMCESLGVEYIWINAHPPQKVNSKINDYLKKGNTLIHCLHGADRTGGHVGGYLFKSGIMTDPNKIWEYTLKFNNWKYYIKNGGFYSKGGMGTGFSQYALTFLTEKQLKELAPSK